MFLLFSIYGFRSVEVRGLTLEDIDWHRGLITVRRAKLLVIGKVVKGLASRDLRATLPSIRWIRRKEDLNAMLPAVEAYMGNVGLESTERYLQMTPQRFQKAWLWTT